MAEEKQDRRELILSRLFTVLETLKPTVVKNVYRNRGEVADEYRPAITMLDADESVGPVAPSGRPQLATPPEVVTMRPEVFILLEGAEPKNEEVGQRLNAIRRKIINAVNADTTLGQHVSNNGSIVYEGCDTDLATGRSMQGQMQIRFAFRYKLSTGELAE